MVERKIPPHFVSDVCLRCGREFRHGEACLVVFGGPDARYRDVGLVICRDCFQGEQLDKILTFTTYVIRGGEGVTWPRYCGSYGVDGWAKVSRLSNGAYRVGLHRGHVEVWPKESVETTASFVKSHVGEMGYSKDYGLYGPKSLGDFIVHTEEEIRFVDLTKPEPMTTEAALDRFRRLDERKAKELLAHYEDVFGEAPRLEELKSGKVPEEFLGNLKALEDMFRTGKVGVSERCPTCQEIMRHRGKGGSISHCHGFTAEGSGPAPDLSARRSGKAESKPVGRYSEALDKQLELADLWSSLEMRRGFEAAIAERFAERGSHYEASQVANMVLPPLLRGETFYWNEPICGLIESAARSIPDTWTLREEALEALHAFAWLARPISISSSEAPVCAIGWFPVRVQGGRVEEVSPPYERPVLTDPGHDALCLVFFSLSPPSPLPFPRTMAFWPIMAPLRKVQNELAHQSESGFTMREKAALFATMVAFLEQRILVSSRFLADRAARRRSEKARQALPSEEVSVVALRRVAYRGEGRHRDVEWTCQWIVRGHWRDQWYASQKHYRPKWIAPYVKGPEDKPLRNPGHVFAVIR